MEADYINLLPAVFEAVTADFFTFSSTCEQHLPRKNDYTPRVTLELIKIQTQNVQLASKTDPPAGAASLLLLLN